MHCKFIEDSYITEPVMIVTCIFGYWCICMYLYSCIFMLLCPHRRALYLPLSSFIMHIDLTLLV